MAPVPLLVASLAFSAFQGIMQQRLTAEAAEDAAKAENIRNQRAQEELSRQQEEAGRQADEAKSDRMRAAEKEMAFLMVAGADAGSGSMSMAQRVSEIGFVEGQDLSRIEANRRGQVDSLQSQKEASREAVTNTIARGRNESRAATVSGVLGFTSTAISAGALYAAAPKGAGVQIGGGGAYASRTATRSRSALAAARPTY